MMTTIILVAEFAILFTDMVQNISKEQEECLVGNWFKPRGSVNVDKEFVSNINPNTPYTSHCNWYEK